MSEKSDNIDFWVGVLVASIFWMFTIAMSVIIVKCEPQYKDKLVIEYRNQKTEYDREIFTNILDKSGIETNFVNKKINLWKWGARIELVNP